MHELLHSFWFLVAVTVIVCSVVGTVAQAWQKVRRGEQELRLKQEMLRRGLSVEEMERVLRASAKGPDAPSPSPDEKAVEQLIKCLVEHGTSGRVVEQVLAAVRSSGPALQRSLCRAVKAVVENSPLEGEAHDEQVLAVVRGLVNPAPPARAANVDEAFQPVRPL